MDIEQQQHQALQHQQQEYANLTYGQPPDPSQWALPTPDPNVDMHMLESQETDDAVAVGKRKGDKVSLADLKDCPPGVKPYHAYSTLIRYAIKGSSTGEFSAALPLARDNR